MALSLGDINPELNKKSALQMENERKAQEQAKLKSTYGYIGTGVTPDQIKVPEQTKKFVEPGADLSKIMNTTNQYMGPTMTMGQTNPQLNQQSALQQKNAQKQATPMIAGETDAMRQARARNESMVQAGIQPYQQGTPQAYDVKSAQEQAGYTPTYGGRTNIAPELFYDPKRAELLKKQQEALKGYDEVGRMMPERGLYKDDASYQEAMRKYTEYQSAQQAVNQYDQTEGQQFLAQKAQEGAQIADRDQSQLAQIGASLTGDPRFDAQLQMGGQFAQDQIQFAEDRKKRADELTRQQLINSYMQTNISDLGYNKADLNKMSLEQLQSLASAEGIELSDQIKERLTANGKLQIENEKLARENNLADIEMTRRQLERQLGRGVREQEDFNTQQDTKLRRMLGMFGGGQVQDLAGNMAVMDYQQKGITALNDLRADYADRMDSLGRQYNSISMQYGNNIKQIENQMAGAIEGAYADLMGKIEGYISQGVKNEDDLASAIMGAKKEYLQFYMDTTNKAAEFMQKENEMLFNQMIKLQDTQRAEDKQMSEMYGVVFQNGRPVLDEQGMQVPTMDNMRFLREEDRFMSEQTGVIYDNGQPKLDSRGNTIPTISSQRLQMEQLQKERQYELDVAQFNQGQYEFEQKQGLDLQQLAQQQRKSEYDIIKAQVDSGALPSSALQAFTPAATIASSYEYIPKNAKVGADGLIQGAKNLGDVLSEAAKWAQKAFIPAECVGFVRKVVPDLPTGLYTLSDKLTKIGKVFDKVNTPQPGDVIVQSTGEAAGHVAVVSGYDPTTGKIAVSEYNWKPGQYGTRLLDLNDKSIEGFFRSPNVSTSSQATVSPTISNITKKVLSSIPFTKRKEISADITDMVSQGNPLATYDYLKKVALDSVPSAVQTKYYDFDNVRNELDYIQNTFNANADTGVYAKILNDTRKWVDLEKDQEYASLTGRLALAQAEFRNQLYGASVTPQEQAMGADFLFDPSDKMTDIIRKLDNMKGYSERLQNNILSRSMGIERERKEAIKLLEANNIPVNEDTIAEVIFSQ
jgi:hypothetical protein